MGSPSKALLGGLSVNSTEAPRAAQVKPQENPRDGSHDSHDSHDSRGSRTGCCGPPRGVAAMGAIRGRQRAAVLLDSPTVLSPLSWGLS
jgi:hypothetical protein